MIDSCLGCGQQGLRRVRPYRTDSRHGRNVLGGSWLYECSGCGLVQAAPRPDARELNDYYSVDYRRAGYYGSDVADPTAFPKDNLFYYNRGQSIADLVAPRVRAESPRILDIGAGFGHILYALGERFPKSRRTAIEFSG
ncbi:MAG: hypothetical protein HYR60_24830, partial [Acidobacteria bacterium]|nr:hypothetical protein [Acidobacteriota bacterium]